MPYVYVWVERKKVLKYEVTDGYVKKVAPGQRFNTRQIFRKLNNT